MPLHWLTVSFCVALAAETLVRLWLASRQIRAVSVGRAGVPELFRGAIALTDHQKAADYTLARVRLGRWATLLEVPIKAGLTLGGGLAAIDALVRRLSWSEPWQGAATVLAVLVLMQAVGLPFSLYRTFRIEQRFGFNRTSPRLYALDLLKQAALGLALGVPLIVATIALMTRAGPWWWAWAFLLWLVFSLTISWAAPRFIAPLFNRFSPITDAALRQRIERLAERCGFVAGGGVFVMDGSRRSAHGNAYFTGMGRNKRIVFFDTLLARIEPEEMEAVLAHELGHFILRHVRHRLLLSMVVMLAGLALLGALARLPGFYAALGVPYASPAMALLLFSLTVPVFTFFATPITSWWSRRDEFAADAYAVAHTSGAVLSRALIKLYRDNAAALVPDPWHSAFYDSHPPAIARIARLAQSGSRGNGLAEDGTHFPAPQN